MLATIEDDSRAEEHTFFAEYTSQDAIVRYTRSTAGFGISYLLDHDYKEVYLETVRLLPAQIQLQGIRILEFGCGAGMNLIHLMSILNRAGVRVSCAIGTDFSPVLIEAATREAAYYLPVEDQCKVKFYLASNEQLITDLSAAARVESSSLENAFHFILGINTIRYCHASGNEVENTRDLFNLLVPGGVCVVIDMNNRFPFFRSDLKNRFCRQKEKKCYVPSLEEYAAPFAKVGFEVLRKEHFCWVPHSSSKLMCRVLSGISPLLDLVARSRAMRSLVVTRKSIGTYQ